MLPMSPHTHSQMMLPQSHHLSADGARFEPCVVTCTSLQSDPQSYCRLYWESMNLTCKLRRQALTTLHTRRGLRRLHSLADYVCIQGVNGRVNDLRGFSPSLIEPRKCQIGWLLEDRTVTPTLTEIKCCKRTR